MAQTDDHFTLLVEFSGLCAFVPNTEIDEQSTVDQMHVLLVRAVPENIAAFEGKFEEVDDISEHFPLFIFNPIHLRGVEISEVDPPSTRCVRGFRSEEVWIEPSSSERVRLRSTGAHLPEPDPDHPEQFSDFCWVPQLEDVLGGAGEISRDLVEPEADESRISGCIHLFGGELSTDLEIRNAKVPPTLYRFVPQGDIDNPLEQVLASKVSWVREIEGESVTFIFKRFNSEERTRVTLFPFSEGGRRVVKIEIIDLCSPSVFDPINDRDDEGLPRGESDFKWFYLLSGVGDGSSFPPSPQPIRFSTIKSGGAGGGEPQICTGSQTKPPTG